MLAKILIPVTGSAQDNTKANQTNGQTSGKPSYLLVPALPVAEMSARAAK